MIERAISSCLLIFARTRHADFGMIMMNL